MLLRVLLVCVFEAMVQSNYAHNFTSVSYEKNQAKTTKGVCVEVVHSDSTKSRNRFWQKITKIVRAFSSTDTTYIEPQHYNYTFMLQNSNTFEMYHLRNKDGHVYTFSPNPSYKLGPYVGWRWIFLGYTIDLTNLSVSEKRQDLNLSLYSNQVGVDLYFRKSGNDYRINSVYLGKNFDTSALKNINFRDFHSSIRGFNFYYIFNHKKFSYPAAYSQSTTQKKSVGSAIAGFGYTKHSLDVDWKSLRNIAANRLGPGKALDVLDSSFVFSNIDYTSFSVSGGYAYNWVPVRNCLFDISFQACLAYKRAVNQVKSTSSNIFRDFDFGNINIDGVGRAAFVWNNRKWYFGGSAVWQIITYRKEQFYTNNLFGNVNFYIGFNFGKK